MKLDLINFQLINERIAGTGFQFINAGGRIRIENESGDFIAYSKSLASALRRFIPNGAGGLTSGEIAIAEKPFTLAQMRAANKAVGHHFFDRDTLKFFGETMRMYSASYYGGKNYITRSGGKCGYKEFRFDPSNGDIRPCVGFKRDEPPRDSV